jgi:hypothetical protein
MNMQRVNYHQSNFGTLVIMGVTSRQREGDPSVSVVFSRDSLQIKFRV